MTAIFCFLFFYLIYYQLLPKHLVRKIICTVIEKIKNRWKQEKKYSKGKLIWHLQFWEYVVTCKSTDHSHDKYITTPEFNELTAENFATRLGQANLASKSDITNFVKKTDFWKNEWK